MDTAHRPHPRRRTPPPPPDIYRDAIRHRLGCQFLPEATTCHCCGKLLDVQCVHAGCCATSEATRSHYAVVRAITAVAKAIDPTTSREETYGDARLRPGDVITNAVLDGRRVAIDVGVTSQAKCTQGDPIQDYQNKKSTSTDTSSKTNSYLRAPASARPSGPKKEELGRTQSK